MKTYSLKCLAPDGERVTERNDFPTIEAAWSHANDMGSRWFFYPICVVTAGGSEIIRAVPENFPKEWDGKRLSTLRACFAKHSQHVADFCNGRCPFQLYPSDWKRCTIDSEEIASGLA